MFSRSRNCARPVPGSGRRSSRRALACCALIVVAVLGLAAAGQALTLAEAEEIYAEAIRSEDGAVTRAAAETLFEAEEGFAAPGILWTRIGMLYLKLKDKSIARTSFERALEIDRSLVAAHYGLGRVYLDLRDDAKKAARHLIRAVKMDSTYSEAYYALGQAFLDMDDKRAVKAANDALRHDPSYAPAHLLLAQWALKKGDWEKTISGFKRFLELDPDDVEDAFEFAMKLLDMEKHDEVYNLASVLRDEWGFPLKAQVLLDQGEYEDAMDLWRRYVDLLPEDERDLYRNISLVGNPEEIAAYENTPSENREAFLKRFWFERDPFKTSGGAMRRAEHYRRIWYAKRFFGEGKWPWDRRGEVYVRFGEPDWRSAWNRINARIPIPVQRVQEKLAFQLYGREAVGMTFYGPVYPIRATKTLHNPIEAKYGGIGTTTQPLSTHDEYGVGLEFFRPVTVGNDWSAVGWEVWIYADLSGGLEIAFIDEMYAGNYDFAPPPTESPNDLDEIAAMREGFHRRLANALPSLSPSTRVRLLVNEMPERYDVRAFQPLEFYYDVLSFRGWEGMAEVQLNIGLPLDNVYTKGDGDTVVVVERRVALSDSAAQNVKTRRESFGVRVSKDVVGKSLVAMDRLDLDSAPGDYVLALQMSRPNSDRMQAYNQAIRVPDYHNGELSVSSLQVAQKISDADQNANPKFVRGALEIIPSPSRSYRKGDPLFVYFEIYSLTRDDFGQTRYEVAFEVRKRGKTERATILTGVKKRTGETVSVRYEQVGRDRTKKDYVELAMGKAEPGWYTVQMMVKDTNSGSETTRSGDFRVLKD